MIYDTKHQMDQAMTLLDNAQIMPGCKKAINEFLTDLSVSGIEDLIDRLEDKVRHGRLLVFGSSQTITDLDDGVYTPGTPASADFGLFMLPGLR